MTTFYVDPAGSDSANGTSQATAWKTVTKVNNALLNPGDIVKFKRGGTWAGIRLKVDRPGASGNPIKLTSYGSGALPVIRDSTSGQIRITASWVTVEQFTVDMDWALLPTQDVGHGPIPVQSGLHGISVANNAANVIVRRNRVLHQMSGIYIGVGSNFCKVMHNHVEGNGVMEGLSVSSPGGDLGAWGINLHGDDNEVGWNYLKDNVAPHQNAAGTWHSNSCELYKASRAFIHHNQAWGDRVFSEVGADPATYGLATDNVWVYNLHVMSNLPNGRFFNAHGSNDQYGPVKNSTVAHNTVVLDNGTGEVGIIAGDLPVPGDLHLHSNIIWADNRTVDPASDIDNHDNIYWSTDGTPSQSWPPGGGMGAGDRLVNPGFQNKGADDYRLSASSPAINAGAGTSGVTKDLGGRPSVVGGTSDIGAFEYQC